MYDPALLIKRIIEDLVLDIPIGIHRRNLHQYETYILIYNAGGNNTTVIDKYIIAIEIYSDRVEYAWNILQEIRTRCINTKNEILDDIQIIEIKDFGLPCNNPDKTTDNKVSFIYNLQISIRNNKEG